MKLALSNFVLVYLRALARVRPFVMIMSPFSPKSINLFRRLVNR